jgi:hypothetical protein
MNYRKHVLELCLVALLALASRASEAWAEQEGSGQSKEAGSNPCAVCSSDTGVCGNAWQEAWSCTMLCDGHGQTSCVQNVTPACHGEDGKYYHDRISCYAD